MLNGSMFPEDERREIWSRQHPTTRLLTFSAARYFLARFKLKSTLGRRKSVACFCNSSCGQGNRVDEYGYAEWRNMGHGSAKDESDEARAPQVPQLLNLKEMRAGVDPGKIIKT
jgi:hypothetical protein